MKTMKVVLLMMLVSPVAISQAQQPVAPGTMHVSSIHKATEAEKSYHTAFGMQLIEGTIGNLRYTLTDLSGWGGCGGSWVVGKDYEVVKANPQSVVLICGMTRKGPKGKPLKLEFPVATVSEIAAK